jgi:hypothetical protein
VGSLRREGAQCLANAAQRSAVHLNVACESFSFFSYLFPAVTSLLLFLFADLIPLTVLFVLFFIETYRKGSKAKVQKKQQ